MVLRVYNTIKRKKEEFKPITPKKIGMFVCGPTVYDESHIGHARTYLAFDVIARYLRYRGFKLNYIMNITDIDDKIIKRANELKKDAIKFAEEHTQQFYRDMETLGIDTADKYAKATDHLPEIIGQIKILIEKGYAYESGGDVYYSIGKFKDYGKLSNQSTEQMKAGARVEVNPKKKNPLDFTLWKAQKPGEPFWESPWGKGRPGWHIEDTAITEKYLGQQYDIHGGAKDLIFPHHEAEIAQMEAASGKKPLVRYWIHTGFLKVKGEKMAKSLGNFITIQDLLKEHEPDAFRLFVLLTHYRSPIDFTEESLKQAESSLERLRNSFESIKSELGKAKKGKADKKVLEEVEKHKKSFVEAMDDDFNTPIALSALFELVKTINKYLEEKNKNKKVLERALKILEELSGIFKLGLKRRIKVDEKTITELAELIGELEPDSKIEGKDFESLMNTIVELREKARSEKDYKKSDLIRKKLGELNIYLEDTKKGAKWVVR